MLAAAHMRPMTNTPATENASISKVCAPNGHRTVVMLSSSQYQSLPMTLVTVTLRPGELFMATGANGKVAYTETLKEAWWFAHNNGSDGVPDAIQVLSRCLDDNGISTMNTHSVYELSVAITE